MTDHSRYDVVVKALPATLPAVSRERALLIRAAIVRKFFTPAGLRCPYGWDGYGFQDGRPTRPRQVWVTRKPTSPHANRGLARLIHDMSHGLFQATYGKRRKPHDPLHVAYERRVAEYVAEHIPAWFPPPKPEPVKKPRDKGAERAAKLAKTQAAITKWTVKHKRAVNKLRKLRARERGLVRAISRGIGWEP